MKTLITLLLITAAITNTFAQFKLTGKIKNYSGKEDLQLNIPAVFGFHKENSINIPIDKNGNFGIVLPLKTQKLSSLIFQRKFFTLLLTPSKGLHIDLNVIDTSLNAVSGSALAENKVLQRINLEEYPFFFQNADNNKFSTLSLNQLKEQVLMPYFAQRDKKIDIINQSEISAADKTLISSEVKFIAYNYLNDLARTQIKDREVVESLILEIFDGTTGKPDLDNAGPQYFAFANNYIRYLETKAFRRIKAENIKPTEAIPYFEISLDSANTIVKKYGKPYWRWIGFTKNLPEAVTEKHSYQEILNLYEDKDLRQAEALKDAFISHFPKSKYNSDILNKINKLKIALRRNETNDSIKIINNYDKVTSIYEVIKKFKGKVVYLDVWGTWCGPCKDELKYNLPLKRKFANKNLEFVYLDMDDDERDEVWREFIKVNGLTGNHLRKNRKTISPFWKELLKNNPDKAEYYPQYFIFDSEGNLAVSKALRPSDKEELYKQIESVLTKTKY